MNFNRTSQRTLFCGLSGDLAWIYMKITISEWKQVLCKTCEITTTNITLCEQCGYYTQTWVTLICDHKVCEECFNSSIDYICPKDHHKTTKDQAQRGDSISELKYQGVYCPGCERPMLFTNITEHIRSDHPELLENADEPRQHQIDGKSLYYLPRALDETKLDREIVTCTHCNTPLETKEVKEHEKSCPDRRLHCPWCEEQVPAKQFEVHVTTLCPAKERKGTVETLRTQRASNGCDVSNKRTELIGDVQEMKERIKKLEDTMNRIEKPLQKIIERLSREQ